MRNKARRRLDRVGASLLARTGLRPSTHALLHSVKAKTEGLLDRAARVLDRVQDAVRRRPAGDRARLLELVELKRRNVAHYEACLRNPRFDRFPASPLEMWLEVSNACNMRCAMCADFGPDDTQSSIFRDPHPGVVGEDVRCAIVPAFAGLVALHCHGFGEPLLYRGLAELVEEAKAHAVYTDFFTNGMRLGAELAERFVRCGLDRITVSMNGTTSEQYTMVHTGGRFELVCENLARLRDLKVQYRTDKPALNLQLLAIGPIFETLPDAVRLAADLGTEGIALNAMNIYETNARVHHWHMTYRPERDDRVLDECARLAARYGIAFDADAYRASRNTPEGRPTPGPETQKTLDLGAPDSEAAPPSLYDERGRHRDVTYWDELDEVPVEQESAGGRCCVYPFKGVFVKRNGDVKACCFAHGPVLGNVLNTPVLDIWGGAGYARLRHDLVAHRYPKDCRFCLDHRCIVTRDNATAEQMRNIAAWVRQRVRADRGK